MCSYALWSEECAVAFLTVHELAACQFIGQVCVLVYMDDILVYSKMADDHVEHVKAVFECLVA